MAKRAVGYNFVVALCLLSWTIVLAYLTFNYSAEFSNRGSVIHSLTEWRIKVKELQK